MPTVLPAGASAEDEAARLSHALEGLRDSSLRLAWTRDALERLGAATGCEVVGVTLRRAKAGDQSHKDLLLMVSVALLSPEQRELRKAIVAVAEIRGHHAVHELLRDAEPPLSEHPAVLPIPDFGQGRPLALGERKSLARRRDRSLMSRVLRDPHPDVIRVLLDNPTLTETDVLRLCALRPVPAEVLVEVFRHPRWITHYHVRVALTLNPHTPELVATQLVPHLTDPDRKQVAQCAGLPERVRLAAL